VTIDNLIERLQILSLDQCPSDDPHVVSWVECAQKTMRQAADEIERQNAVIAGLESALREAER
jgi:hypothetical protein